MKIIATAQSRINKIASYENNEHLLITYKRQDYKLHGVHGLIPTAIL